MNCNAKFYSSTYDKLVVDIMFFEVLVRAPGGNFIFEIYLFLSKNVQHDRHKK